MTEGDVYRHGEYFESRFPYDATKDPLWDEIGDFLNRTYGLGETVVDVGSGYSYFLNGVDSPRRVAVDRSGYPLRERDDGVEGVVGDAIDLPLSSGTADSILVSNVLEHLSTDDIRLALAEIRRVLRPDGKLFVITPNFALAPTEYFHDFTHESILTHKSVADLLSVSGFDVLDTTVRFLPFSSDGSLPVSRLLVRLYFLLPFRPLAGQSLLVATPRQSYRG